MSTENSIESSKAPEPVGLYPHARRVGNLLFLSGVGPRERGTKKIPGVELDENGNIIWASAIADVQGDFISSYLAIPFVKEQSVPINFSQFKETTSQRFLPKDIQPASSPEFGYGVVGTYSEAIDGSKSNLFFLL